MATREEIREGMQKLWCQHCKAMQKTNDTVVECWYNPFAVDGDYAFCASNEDATDAILKDESDRGVVIKVDRELPEIIDWLIERRRKLQEVKEHQLQLKPKDVQSARIAGIKARALQEVINYINSRRDKSVESLI